MAKSHDCRDGRGSISASKLVATLVAAMVLGVCGWAINAVRQHEVMLERHNEQIAHMKEAVDDLRVTIKDEFREIKNELRKKP